MTNLSSFNLFLALLVALLMPKLSSASNFDFPADPELVVNKSTGLSVPKGFETDLVYKSGPGEVRFLDIYDFRSQRPIGCI